MISEVINSVLKKNTLMSIATKGEGCIENAVVCFAYDNEKNIYFGSYTDTLKCRNIAEYNQVAVTIDTLQFHGKANLVPYGTSEYYVAREVYDKRYPQFKNMFEQEKNELYKITPLVIWNYNPLFGETYRDELIINNDYYNNINSYKYHKYNNRSNNGAIR